MPPKVTIKQAANFAEALVKGEPNGGKIALRSFATKVNKLDLIMRDEMQYRSGDVLKGGAQQD